MTRRLLHIVVTPEDEKRLRQSHERSIWWRGFEWGALIAALLGLWGGWLLHEVVKGACP